MPHRWAGPHPLVHDCSRESQSWTCAGTSGFHPLSMLTLTFARSRCKEWCTLVNAHLVVSQGLPGKPKAWSWSSLWYLVEGHIHIHHKNIACPVTMPWPYVYNIISAYHRWNSKSLCQAPSSSTTTQVSPPIVILTGLFEAHSHSSVYLGFTASCQ